MKKSFPTNLYYLDTFRSRKDNAFKIYPRKLHRYKLGLEILLEALIYLNAKDFFMLSQTLVCT